MLNRVAYWNSRPGGVAALEVVENGENTGRSLHRFVPLRRTVLRGEVVGPLARLRLIHTYSYTSAESAQTLEAIYRFPLPGDTAVSGVLVRFGEVKIQAELQEREQAEATYAEAQAQGFQVALATRESPDVFTLRLSGLQPDQPITIETTYVQLPRAEGPGWMLRVPLTTAPRYVREDERGSRRVAGQPLDVLRDPGHRFALDLTVRGAAMVRSATHDLAITEEEGDLRVRLRQEEVVPDRDCVLQWQPRQERRRAALQLFGHDDSATSRTYFLALVAPPVEPSPGLGVAREVVLLVDHSGSMSGAKWAAADWTVKRFLAGLTERDTFALGVFHDHPRWFDRSVKAATGRRVSEATAFLEAARDSGGTNLGVALEGALHLPPSAGDRARHLLIVTDAEVSDAARILRLADEESRKEARRRISVLCIDAAPNAFLAQELADRGGGVARFLTSSPEEDDITTALDEVLADWSAPVLAGLRLAIDRAGVETSGGVAQAGAAGESQIDLGDLPAGRTVWIAGRVPGGAGAALTLRLVDASGAEHQAIQLDPQDDSGDLSALKALFGARRVLALEYLRGAHYEPADLREQLRRLGYDPDQVLDAQAASGAIYAENRRQQTAQALRSLLVREALDYGVASDETAFVAVRREAGKQVEERVTVGNALPSGWSESFLTGSLPMKLAFASPAGGFDAAAMPAMRHFSQTSAPTAHFSPPSPPGAAVTLFAGVPELAGGEAVLFDSSRPASNQTLPASGVLTSIALRFRDRAPDPARLDPALSLSIFVADLAVPRARVRLADLLRQGSRPLNLSWRDGEVVRIVLSDPSGVWVRQAPALEIELRLV